MDGGILIEELVRIDPVMTAVVVLLWREIHHVRKRLDLIEDHAFEIKNGQNREARLRRDDERRNEPPLEGSGAGLGD